MTMRANSCTLPAYKPNIKEFRSGSYSAEALLDVYPGVTARRVTYKRYPYVGSVNITTSVPSDTYRLLLESRVARMAHSVHESHQ